MMREFEIERQFNMRIEKMKPKKGIFYLRTDKGERCLKKVNYGIQKLLFVYGAKEHLVKNGFKNIDRYFLNENNEPYALVNEDLYTLSRWIKGRECDFTNIDEVRLASIKLAQLHEASKGYDPPENSKLKTDLGRWPHLMEKRGKALEKMRGMARKKNLKKDFDLIYITNIEFYKELAIRAAKVLNSSEYLSLCDEAEQDKVFCHHDYTYHNIIIGEDNEIYILDFDYSKREIRTYDIANFIKKVLKRVDWNIEYAEAILDAYNSVSPLKEEEYKVIYAFLLFPQRYWRLANRYYYNEVMWGENIFLNKINNIINEKENYIKFISDFKEKYNQEG